MEQDIQTALAEITTSVKNITTELATRQANFAAQLDLVRAELLKPHQDAAGMTDPGFAGYVSPGTQLTTKGDMELLRKTGRLRFALDQVHPLQTKALIDSASLGFATPGIISAERISSSIVPLPRRRLTIRDLLRTRPVSAGQVDWIREATFTNNASPQTEGSEKSESESTFEIASEKVRTLAHWLAISKQAADDLPELRRFVDENLVYGLKLIEEWEILFADGSGEHLHGIYHQAPSATNAYAAASDTILDKLRHVILELEMQDEQCTAFVLNPEDWHDAELVKTNDGGTNLGAYLIGDPIGGSMRVPTVWGRAVVVTPTMTAGSFLAGDFGNVLLGDRSGAEIAVSLEHSDFFVRNKMAVRVEERISCCLLRTTSLLKGTL